MKPDRQQKHSSDYGVFQSFTFVLNHAVGPRMPSCPAIWSIMYEYSQILMLGVYSILCLWCACRQRPGAIVVLQEGMWRILVPIPYFGMPSTASCNTTPSLFSNDQREEIPQGFLPSAFLVLSNQIHSWPTAWAFPHAFLSSLGCRRVGLPPPVIPVSWILLFLCPTAVVGLVPLSSFPKNILLQGSCSSSFASSASVHPVIPHPEGKLLAINSIFTPILTNVPSPLSDKNKSIGSTTFLYNTPPC